MGAAEYEYVLGNIGGEALTGVDVQSVTSIYIILLVVAGNYYSYRKRKEV